MDGSHKHNTEQKKQNTRVCICVYNIYIIYDIYMIHLQKGPRQAKLNYI